MGLRGAEKTTLARVIAPRSAVVFNVDEVHANISRDLGVSLADSDGVAEAGCVALADFVCPTLKLDAPLATPSSVSTASRPGALRTPISYLRSQ